MSGWRNPDWRYHGAASHANAGAFARRQQQRRRDAQDAAKTAADAAKASNVKPIITSTRKAQK